MLKNKIIYPLSLSAALFAASCGSDEKADDPVITYATLNIENSASGTEDAKIDLTGLTTCTLDPDTDLFTAAFAGPSSQSLEVKIKGFVPEKSTHTCGQGDANNTGAVTTSKYSNCSVKAVVLNKANDAASGINTYEIYRSTSDYDDFTYPGDCSINITYAKPKVTGTITCTKMVQTYYQGAMNNKIREDESADIASTTEFFCNLP